MRRKMVAGNWKMNNTPCEAVAFANSIKAGINTDKADVVLCVPYVALDAVKNELAGTHISVAAQNMHYEKSGAFTGEISGEMLMAMGIPYTLIGHSERRQYYNETDETVNKKVQKALALGLKPILCVGESLEERKKEVTNELLRQQTNHALFGVSAEEVLKVVIAYEPIWAIGTGVVASPKQAEDACAYIRGVLAQKYGTDTANKVTILYGGSVDDKNAAELFGQPNIDGGLVGGASLKPTFADVVKAGLPK